jgi:hypothetical protein
MCFIWEIRKLLTSTLQAAPTSRTDKARELNGRHADSVLNRGALLGALLFLQGCAPLLNLDRALTVVPFTLQGNGRVMVAAFVNEQGPYLFAIDTAATNSFVFSYVSEELGLEPIAGVSANVYGAVANGQFPVTAIDSIRIGTESWRDIRLITIPGNTSATSRIYGVLGADFLRRYSIGVFAQSRSLSLFAPESIAGQSFAGWAAIDLEPRHFQGSEEPLRYLELEIGSYSVPALLDLGAGVSAINSPAARTLRLTTVRPEQRGQFSGAVGTEPVIAQLSSQDLRTGRIRWGNERMLIADLPVFDTLDSSDRPLAILGSGLFSKRDFIVDFSRDRLLVRQSVTEGFN